LDAPFYLSIIRPTSGAVETENSLRFNELEVSGSVGSVSVSTESGEKRQLTAGCNAVEFASR
ncbi:hypothetical protein, partial [Pseudomonas sp. 5P_5.1_Bac1]|uniref:hypothetical protein n=1 Tax=Pseudomonas sp. 5P_5.1_Bac1 TaxID=2971616 RepID=UPI0021CA8866